MSFAKYALGTFLFASSIFAADHLPPQDCLADLEDHDVCIQTRAGAFKGPFELDIYYHVYKDENFVIDQIVARFFDFEKWTGFIESTDQDALKIPYSKKVASGTYNDQGVRREFVTHYQESVAKGPLSIGSKIESKGMTHYEEFAAPERVFKAYRFKLLMEDSRTLPDGRGSYEGPVGLKRQEGRMYFIDGCQTCGEDRALVVYKVIMETDPSLFPSVGARYARDNFKTLFDGIYVTSF